MNKWNIVNHVRDTCNISKDDCELWVTRENCFGTRWVDKILYKTSVNYINYDGVIAWMKCNCDKPEVWRGER